MQPQMSIEEFKLFIRGLDKQALAQFEIVYEKLRSVENPHWNQIFSVKLQPLPP
jgi:hypothetical protein